MLLNQALGKSFATSATPWVARREFRFERRSGIRPTDERPTLQQPPVVRSTPAFDLDGLEALVGTPAIDRLHRLVQQVNRLYHNGDGPMTVWHVNSSGFGGGVADILNYLVPLSSQVGVRSQWMVLGGDARFFTITKAFHNALQGNPHVHITDEMLDYYWHVIATNASALEGLVDRQGGPDPAVIVLHDPQPLGLIHHWRRRFPATRFIWQGHIHFDVAGQSASHPGKRVWQFLAASINQFDAAIFHLPEFVPEGLHIPVRCMLPAINPLGYLNRDLTTPAGQRFIQSTFAKYRLPALHDGAVPLLLQNARFDPWKDPLGVIQAYRAAKARLRSTGPRVPHLVLLGPLAEDDPEGRTVFAQVQEAVNGEETIHLLALSLNGGGLTDQQQEALTAEGLDSAGLRPEEILELEVNAFQTRADVIIAKSTREGFGLTVTGAGYHGKARIVSQVGGIPAQVIDDHGHTHACLVGGTPEFSREASIRMTAEWIVTLLADPDMRRELGERARQHVIGQFLPHRYLEDYLRVFRDLGAPQHERERAISVAGQPVRHPLEGSALA